MYFGFVPGPSSLFGGGPGPFPPDTSVAVPTAPVSDSAAGTTIDSAPAAVAPVAEAAPRATAADSAAGDAVYRGAGRCVGCHGAAGEGAPGLGSSLRESLPRSGDGSPAAIARVVAGGLPPSERFRVAMPAYAGQLDAADVARVAAYVFALAHPGALTTDSTSSARPATPTVPAPADPINADARTTPRPTVPAAPRRP